uniref:Uncharacterized protein n=1 Tax=Physcomitrium patens TaxID=3218 RepID=A0A2K1KCA5_PHYPA|nr:hypothetical protein PHYPA_010592 [Physcomitrium patens]
MIFSFFYHSHHVCGRRLCALAVVCCYLPQGINQRSVIIPFFIALQFSPASVVFDSVLTL